MELIEYQRLRLSILLTGTSIRFKLRLERVLFCHGGLR
jgi:hypothetical protein